MCVCLCLYKPYELNCQLVGSDSISADSSFENDTRPLQRGRQSEARATTVSPVASGRHEHAADVVPVFSNSRDASASNKPPVNRSSKNGLKNVFF